MFRLDRSRTVDPDHDLLWVADLPVAVADVTVKDHPPHSPLVSVRHVLIEVGKWTLSVLWGTGTYSSNHYANGLFPQHHLFTETPTEVELALWQTDNDIWYDPDTLMAVEDIDVRGYVDVAYMQDLLTRLAANGISIVDDE